MSARKSPSRLDSALRVSTPTIIYGVNALSTVLSALESASHKKVSPVDFRTETDGARWKAAVGDAKKAGAPVVVLLGTEMSSTARTLLGDAAEDASVKLVALTPASAPSETMAALFPMQLASARAVEGIA